MIQVTCDAKTPKDSELEVDGDLLAFEHYLGSSNLGPELDRHERAIIKTYLWWKMWGAKGEGGRGLAATPEGQGEGFRF